MRGSSSMFHVVQKPPNPMKVKDGDEPLKSMEGSGSVSQDLPYATWRNKGHLEALHVKNNS